MPELSVAGKMEAFKIAMTAIVLLVSSGFDIPLGLPTLLAGLGTAILVLTRSECGVGKSTAVPPVIMPERLARTDAFTWLEKMFYSGPYRFRVDERVPGALYVCIPLDAVGSRSHEQSARMMEKIASTICRIGHLHLRHANTVTATPFDAVEP